MPGSDATRIYAAHQLAFPKLSLPQKVSPHLLQSLAGHGFLKKEKKVGKRKKARRGKKVPPQMKVFL